jgi:ATP/maltotriose-dependent transcriptional regulator MalT
MGTGELSVKARQRRDAAASLDEAATTFGDLGAPRWQALATAQRARLAPGRDADLTPAERRIAELAASGHSNPEIAAAFLRAYAPIAHPPGCIPVTRTQVFAHCRDCAP